MKSPTWDVVLHSDDITSPDVVTYALVRVLDLPPTDALALAMRAHREGSVSAAAFDEAGPAGDVVTGLRYYGLHCELVSRV
ncbi:ATP-dependent Clp protease adaptor ClpS [Saccharothrix sp. NRRL B-16314]|uniref:ATP-dependent Clp protease adaptor ClpS n=1 Tax=Saccharothrix sp. NRRL B-16314 TaxID=1463825 RepID=UPI0018CC2B80|nr:ATP-dependent Clp protease adaptor ClpS [Saccharothrix sp. NRRL B-16314]